MKCILVQRMIGKGELCMNSLVINHTVTIPEHELEITASRSGGPGGQHVNKTSSRITVRWNVSASQALPDHLKERLLRALAHRISTDGYISVHSSSSRSQHDNKATALALLAALIKSGLRVPKKRIATEISAAKQEARLHKKSSRSTLKKLRSTKIRLDD